VGWEQSTVADHWCDPFTIKYSLQSHPSHIWGVLSRFPARAALTEQALFFVAWNTANVIEP
jgi:hypothetical protein